MDLSAQLFIKSKHKITSVEVEPTAAITIRETQATTTGWKHYALAGHKWGRARVLLSYDDGSKQSINYYVIKPSVQAVSDLGNFLLTKQWFVDADDPFHRSPSVMSYDRETNSIVTPGQSCVDCRFRR